MHQTSEGGGEKLHRNIDSMHIRNISWQANLLLKYNTQLIDLNRQKPEAVSAFFGTESALRKLHSAKTTDSGEKNK